MISGKCNPGDDQKQNAEKKSQQQDQQQGQQGDQQDQQQGQPAGQPDQQQPDQKDGQAAGAQPQDFDADNIPNYRDTDSDNDHIADRVEAGNGGGPFPAPRDTDGAGNPDYLAWVLAETARAPS
mgnify:CR=1 FL=1